MKRLILFSLCTIAVLQYAPPAWARHVRVVHRGPHRTTVVVHRGFPIHRTWPVCTVRPARTKIVIAPGWYAAPVVWSAAVVSLPYPEHLVWEDAEILDDSDGWTDFTLGVQDRGSKLYLEVHGRVQVEFAEVVYASGEAQPVDFRQGTCASGTYRLLDFPDGRLVSHVRLVARARSDEAASWCAWRSEAPAGRHLRRPAPTDSPCRGRPGESPPPRTHAKSVRARSRGTRPRSPLLIEARIGLDPRLNSFPRLAPGSTLELRKSL